MLLCSYRFAQVGRHQHCRDVYPLRWRHNGRVCVSNHQPHDCLLNRLFRRRSKKTSKLRATGLCAGNSPGTGEFPAQMASNAENVSIWWRHHANCIAIGKFWKLNSRLGDFERPYYWIQPSCAILKRPQKLQYIKMYTEPWFSTKMMCVINPSHQMCYVRF